MSELTEIAEYLARLKKEADAQKDMFYKNLFDHPTKEYGFKPVKKEPEKKDEVKMEVICHSQTR